MEEKKGARAEQFILPLASVRRVMASDESVKTVAKSAVEMLCRATVRARARWRRW